MFSDLAHFFVHPVVKIRMDEMYTLHPPFFSCDNARNNNNNGGGGPRVGCIVFYTTATYTTRY